MSQGASIQNLRRFDHVEQHALHELDFMDLYVCLEGMGLPHYRERMGQSGMSERDSEVPPEFYGDIEELADHLRNKFEGIECSIDFGGMRLRAARLETAHGDVWVALRRIESLPPNLDKLGLLPQLVPVLRDLGQRSGLILISGATGQGKTTTASSLMVEYMARFGGIGFTVEDPVEYDLEGRIGTSGYCYQSEVHNDSDWGVMLKRALRWNPRYIFVGEIRTPSAANQLLRAATSGHTVIATMHGGSIEESLEGLLQLVEPELGSRASLLLASGLSIVINQSFGPIGLQATFLATEGNNAGSPARALIREKRIGQCKTLMDQQAALLIRTGKLFQNS